ncbi:phage regulatory CII family protein [Arsenophonus nasoniae]|nr:phage regulatory CII family protein [Arsenophonus nasoniae]QBY42002.1 Phage regulatory protein CII (CP76) [Arsenophonus nasoniae]WGM06196.1 phage regulatory CII family protein [Arsenophonus nasoniae]
MFDYQASKQAKFDDACRMFAISHKGELAHIAKSIGFNSQMLRNKLNPEQPHRLTCSDLIKLTDITEDASLLDGLLEQLRCQPAIPINQVNEINIPTCVLCATAEVGKLANETVTGGHFNHLRIANFKKSVNTAIKCLTLASVTISTRLHIHPVMGSTVDVLTGVSASLI